MDAFQLTRSIRARAAQPKCQCGTNTLPGASLVLPRPASSQGSVTTSRFQGLSYSAAMRGPAWPDLGPACPGPSPSSSSTGGPSAATTAVARYVPKNAPGPTSDPAEQPSREPLQHQQQQVAPRPTGPVLAPPAGPAPAPRPPVAGVRAPRAENVSGEFYVDHTCIDCDTCRWMAPSVFSRLGDMSAVHHQPATEAERLQALQALLSCPTSSIHTLRPPRDIPSAQASFPLPISPELPGVYHCGYHSPKSYGAASYLVRLPGRGGVLVDCPRYTPALAKRLEELGGVDYIFLTHRDDVADHAKWASHFSCPRILHFLEAASLSLRGVEVQLQGEGPWAFPWHPSAGAHALAEEDGTAAAAAAAGSAVGKPDLSILFTPGHTAGHCCLLVRLPSPSPFSPLGSSSVLFSGDHLALDHTTASLSVHPEHNWHSADLQMKSACNLKDLPFLWILPGHGRRYRFRNDQQRLEVLGGFCGPSAQPKVKLE